MGYRRKQEGEIMQKEKLIEWRSREAVAKAAEAATKAYKLRTLEIEAELMDSFADEGVHSIKVDSPSAEALAKAGKEYESAFTARLREMPTALGAMQTIFLWSQWYGVACKNEAGETDTTRFVSAMRDAGYGDLVTESINYHTLGAWLREQIPDGELAPVLPGNLPEDILTTAQKFELRARKA